MTVKRGTAPDIRAAGAVVWRVNGRAVEIALVHRPRYDDWSLPKGKLEIGESELDAAVREVREETGASIAVSRRLNRVAYDVGGAHKQVAYWLARFVSGEFHPNDEVDDVEWLTVAHARKRLSHAVEAAVIEELDQVPMPESVVVLIRHAKAGKRADWSGRDDERPLEATGLGQAAALADFVVPFAPTGFVSAEPVRCIQTVEPAAERLGLPVKVEPAFGDTAFERAPIETEHALTALARHGVVSVVSSQGRAIPGLLDRVWPHPNPPPTRKGTAWVLSYVDGTVLSADHYLDAST